MSCITRLAAERAKARQMANFTLKDYAPNPNFLDARDLTMNL